MQYLYLFISGKTTIIYLYYQFNGDFCMRKQYQLVLSFLMVSLASGLCSISASAFSFNDGPQFSVGGYSVSLFLLLFILLGVIAVISFSVGIYSAVKTSETKPSKFTPEDHREEISQKIKELDSGFDSEEFITFGKATLVNVLEAVTERDRGILEYIEGYRLYTAHREKIENLDFKNQYEVFKNIVFFDERIPYYQLDQKNEVVHLYLSGKMMNYIDKTFVSKSLPVLDNEKDSVGKNVYINFKYILTFTRTAQSSSVPFLPGKCSRCGEQSKELTCPRCTKCGALIEHPQNGWKLVELTRLTGSKKTNDCGIDQ